MRYLAKSLVLILSVFFFLPYFPITPPVHAEPLSSVLVTTDTTKTFSTSTFGSTTINSVILRAETNGTIKFLKNSVDSFGVGIPEGLSGSTTIQKNSTHIIVQVSSLSYYINQIWRLDQTKYKLEVCWNLPSGTTLGLPLSQTTTLINNIARINGLDFDWNDAVVSGYTPTFNNSTKKIEILVPASGCLDPLVGTSTSNPSILGTRNVQFFGNAWYVWYADGSNFVFRCSSAGGSFGSSTTVRAQSATNFWQNTYSNGTHILEHTGMNTQSWQYRVLTPTSSCGTTQTSAVTILSTATPRHGGGVPFQNSTGHQFWTGWEDGDNGMTLMISNNPYGRGDSFTNKGVWFSAAASFGRMGIVNLTQGKMLLWGHNAGVLKVRIYYASGFGNQTYGTLTTLSSSLINEETDGDGATCIPSATSNKAYCLALTTGGVLQLYSFDGSSWTTTTVAYPSTNTAFGITKNWSDDTIYILRLINGENIIKWNKTSSTGSCCSGGSGSFFTGTQTSPRLMSVSIKPNATGWVGMAWRNSSSPFNIEFQTFEAFKNNRSLTLNVKYSDASTALPSATTELNNQSGTHSLNTDASGVVKFTGIRESTQISIIIRYQNAKVNQTANFTLSSDTTFNPYTVTVHRSATFRYYDLNKTSVTPTQNCATFPNATQKCLTPSGGTVTFGPIGNGTISIINITRYNLDVKKNDTQTSISSGGQIKSFIALLNTRNLLQSFVDKGGSRVLLTSIRITNANGTITNVTSSNAYITKGNHTVTQAKWRGINITDGQSFNGTTSSLSASRAMRVYLVSGQTGMRIGINSTKIATGPTWNSTVNGVQFQTGVGQFKQNSTLEVNNTNFQRKPNWVKFNTTITYGYGYYNTAQNSFQYRINFSSIFNILVGFEGTTFSVTFKDEVTFTPYTKVKWMDLYFRTYTQRVNVSTATSYTNNFNDSLTMIRTFFPHGGTNFRVLQFPTPTSTINTTIYLADPASVTLNTYTLTVFDPSGAFNNATITITKLTSIGTITIDQQVTDIEHKVIPQLILNHLYNVQISSSSQTLSLGFLLADSTFSKTLYATNISFKINETSRLTGITWYANRIWPKGFITVNYTSVPTTTSVRFRIYNSSSTLYDQTFNTNIVAINFTSGDSNSSHVFFVRADIVHSKFGSYSEVKVARIYIPFNGTGFSSPLNLNTNGGIAILTPNQMEIGAVIILIMVGLLFGQATAGKGAIIVALLGMGFTVVQWLHIETNIIWVVMLVAGFYELSSRRLPDTQ